MTHDKRGRLTGTVRFIGKHHVTGKNRVGVELDAPMLPPYWSDIAKSDGAFGGHRYFLCEKYHGVLMPPYLVQIAAGPKPGELVAGQPEARPAPTPSTTGRFVGILVGCAAAAVLAVEYHRHGRAQQQAAAGTTPHHSYDNGATAYTTGKMSLVGVCHADHRGGQSQQLIS